MGSEGGGSKLGATPRGIAGPHSSPTSLESSVNRGVSRTVRDARRERHHRICARERGGKSAGQHDAKFRGPRRALEVPTAATATGNLGGPRPRSSARGGELGVESAGVELTSLCLSLSLSVSPHLRVWVGVGYFSAQPSLRGRIPASDSGNPTLAPWRGRDGTVRDEGTCLRVAARRAALASLLGGEGVPLPCGFPATLPSAEGVCFLRDRPQRVAGIRSARADWWRECLGPGGTPPEGERSSSMLKARLGGHAACFARNFERRRRARGSLALKRSRNAERDFYTERRERQWGGRGENRPIQRCAFLETRRFLLSVFRRFAAWTKCMLFRLPPSFFWLQKLLRIFCPRTTENLLPRPLFRFRLFQARASPSSNRCSWQTSTSC